MFTVRRFKKGETIESNGAFSVTMNKAQYAVVDEGGDVVVEHNSLSKRCLYCMSSDKRSMVGCAQVWNATGEHKITAHRMDE